ncbi:hypothetical protein HK405_009360 [Cladochytrium tenue]|nr:hypothetical protein HK405_009360 [Cladochytrium tenue]
MPSTQQQPGGAAAPPPGLSVGAAMFGEMELSSSIGHTPLAAPEFIAPNVVAYISGNAINFVELTSPAAVNAEFESHEAEILLQRGQYGYYVKAVIDKA